MSERVLLIDELAINYDGLFKLSELYRIIDSWLARRFYDKQEGRNVEKIHEDHKYVELELNPWKNYTDYAQSKLRIRIISTDLKEVEVEKSGKIEKFNKGDLTILFDAYLVTDYEGRWEATPWMYIIRALFDKYIYRAYTGKYEGRVKKDCMDLYQEIKNFLNLYYK